MMNLYINQRDCVISTREQEVLQCLAEGLTTQETAWKLHISNETVKSHRSRLLQKTDAKNSFQLGMLASKLGLIAFGNIRVVASQ